jgi:hypothetical protein
MVVDCGHAEFELSKSARKLPEAVLEIGPDLYAPRKCISDVGTKVYRGQTSSVK